MGSAWAGIVNADAARSHDGVEAAEEMHCHCVGHVGGRHLRLRRRLGLLILVLVVRSTGAGRVVLSEVALAREGLSAGAATVRLLARVHADVARVEIGRIGEALAAHVAAVRLLTAVHAHVPRAGGRVGETLAAHVAAERLLAAVKGAVPLQVGVPREDLVADRARDASAITHGWGLVEARRRRGSALRGRAQRGQRLTRRRRPGLRGRRLRLDVVLPVADEAFGTE
jgi:hypothetical protein